MLPILDPFGSFGSEDLPLGCNQHPAAHRVRSPGLIESEVRSKIQENTGMIWAPKTDGSMIGGSFFYFSQHHHKQCSWNILWLIIPPGKQTGFSYWSCSYIHVAIYHTVHDFWRSSNLQSNLQHSAASLWLSFWTAVQHSRWHGLSDPLFFGTFRSNLRPILCWPWWILPNWWKLCVQHRTDFRTTGEGGWR